MKKSVIILIILGLSIIALVGWMMWTQAVPSHAQGPDSGICDDQICVSIPEVEFGDCQDIIFSSVPTAVDFQAWMTAKVTTQTVSGADVLTWPLYIQVRGKRVYELALNQGVPGTLTQNPLMLNTFEYCAPENP